MLQSLDRHKEALEVLEEAKRDLNSLIVSEEFELALEILSNLGSCYLTEGLTQKAKTNYMLAKELISEN